MQRGDLVLRKSHAKNPTYYWAGTVQEVFAVDRWGSRCNGDPTHAVVAWPSSGRLGGNGTQRSTIKLQSLVVVTAEDIATRKAARHAEREQHQQWARSLVRRPL